MRHPFKAYSYAAALGSTLAVLGTSSGATAAQAPAPPAAAPLAPPLRAPGSGAVPPPPRAALPPPRPGLAGTIVAARPYRIQIRTREGRYITLHLRRGTVINPLGTTLAPGMRVAVRGIPDSSGAVATDQVDVRVGPPDGLRAGARAPRPQPPAPVGLAPGGPGAPNAPGAPGAPAAPAAPAPRAPGN